MGGAGGRPGGQRLLLKSCSRDELLAAIRTAAEGERVWTRESFRRVTGAMSTPRLIADTKVPLTAREGQVLRQMATGLDQQADRRGDAAGHRDGQGHIQHILGKIGVTDRTQAAVWAVRNGLA